jgi:hypothetical protein
MVTLKDAKYAIAALIDEAVLCSDWEGRISLDESFALCSLKCLAIMSPGRVFLSGLPNCDKSAKRIWTLIELYYVCLQLGFEGIYKVRGLEQLMALQVDLRSQIEGISRGRRPAPCAAGCSTRRLFWPVCVARFPIGSIDRGPRSPLFSLVMSVMPTLSIAWHRTASEDGGRGANPGSPGPGSAAGFGSGRVRGASMKTLLLLLQGYLLGRTGSRVVGLLLLISLIWWAGPYVGLQSEVVRLGIIVTLLLA